MIAVGWKSLNWILLVGAMALITMLFWGVWLVSRPIAGISERVSDFHVPNPTIDKSIRPTASEIESAGNFKLQRIKKPEPVATVSDEPSIQQSNSVIQFDGTLVGTMVDSEPKQSYALINMSNATTKLTKLEEFVDPPANSYKLLEVHAESIVVEHVPSGQTIYVEVVRR